MGLWRRGGVLWFKGRKVKKLQLKNGQSTHERKSLVLSAGKEYSREKKRQQQKQGGGG